MPEGPSIVILRDELARFAGRKATVSGSAKIDYARVTGRKVRAFRSFGKQFLVEFADTAIRVHFLLFGSWRIDERKAGSVPRLTLKFANGELNCYACAVRLLDGDLDTLYDWRGDVMSPQWDPALARKRLRAMPDALACDALLDQDVFAGVGNIIKNEVLFRIRVHPQSLVGALPRGKLEALVREAHAYAHQFHEWKLAGTLTRNLLAHKRKTCPRCDIALKLQVLGASRRRAFFCSRCQVRYRA